MDTIVQIQRSRYAYYFQVTRALMSAASALIPTDRLTALNYIDDAITELKLLKAAIQHVS
jgi:hypothetical protein